MFLSVTILLHFKLFLKFFTGIMLPKPLMVLHLCIFVTLRPTTILWIHFSGLELAQVSGPIKFFWGPLWR